MTPARLHNPSYIWASDAAGCWQAYEMEEWEEKQNKKQEKKKQEGGGATHESK